MCSHASDGNVGWSVQTKTSLGGLLLNFVQTFTAPREDESN